MAMTRPWSKAFLASAYASRGVKIRFTSGTGSEALMGRAEQKSMLYLEARCLLVVKGRRQPGGAKRLDLLHRFAGSACPAACAPCWRRTLLAAMLGLEVAAGNDALASHSSIRKAAKLMLQFIPGADFVFSGYSAIPKRDNLFGGGNFDAEDFDDYNVLQRDMQVDGGVKPISEDEALNDPAAKPRAPFKRFIASLALPSDHGRRSRRRRRWRTAAMICPSGISCRIWKRLTLSWRATSDFVAGHPRACKNSGYTDARRQYPRDGTAAHRGGLPAALGDIRCRLQSAERHQRRRMTMPVRAADIVPNGAALARHRKPSRKPNRRKVSSSRMLARRFRGWSSLARRRRGSAERGRARAGSRPLDGALTKHHRRLATMRTCWRPILSGSRRRRHDRARHPAGLSFFGLRRHRLCRRSFERQRHRHRPAIAGHGRHPSARIWRRSTISSFFRNRPA